LERGHLGDRKGMSESIEGNRFISPISDRERSTVTFTVAVRSNLTDTYVHLLTPWDYRAHSMLRQGKVKFKDRFGDPVVHSCY
jgi:hypothetical protein